MLGFFGLAGGVFFFFPHPNSGAISHEGFGMPKLAILGPAKQMGVHLHSWGADIHVR